MGSAKRLASVVVVLAAFAASLPTAPAGAAEQAPGTGKPPAGTGVDTPAAYANPLCDRDAGTYGRIGLVTKALWGPACLPAKWKGDNGGATYQGVTKDSIKAVVLLPNDQQLTALGSQSRPANYGTGQPGTIRAALEDSLAPYVHFFDANTYGRDVDFEYMTSKGSDEASQRADAVAVKDLEPFVVLDMAGSLEVFDSQIAAAKMLVFSLYTTVKGSLQQAPYRWGQQDNAAAMINGAEFVGKQVAGKKAAYVVMPRCKTRRASLVLSRATHSTLRTSPTRSRSTRRPLILQRRSPTRGRRPRPGTRQPRRSRLRPRSRS